MKNLKEKMRTKSFWVVLAGAVVLLLQVLGLKVNAPYVNELVNAACAVMIILGVMTGGDTAKKEDENAPTPPERESENAPTPPERESENAPSASDNENATAALPLRPNGGAADGKENGGDKTK